MSFPRKRPRRPSHKSLLRRDFASVSTSAPTTPRKRKGEFWAAAAVRLYLPRSAFNARADAAAVGRRARGPESLRRRAGGGRGGPATRPERGRKRRPLAAAGWDDGRGAGGRGQGRAPQQLPCGIGGSFAAAPHAFARTTSGGGSFRDGAPLLPLRPPVVGKSRAQPANARSFGAMFRGTTERRRDDASPRRSRLLF